MISIAMATYNGEKFLKEQIDSILNQTVKETIELVVCDDMSTDNTRQILSEYANNDSRIKIYFNETNLGFSKNFLKTISLCKGDFIAFSDQDDIWEANKLELLMQNIGEKDFVCSNALLVDEKNEPLGFTMKEVCNYHWIPSNKDLLFKRIVFTNIAQGSTMLAKADFLKAYCKEVPAEIKYHDWWFALNSCAKNGFVYTDECTIRYRQHNSNVTTNNEQTLKDDMRRTNSSLADYKKLCEQNAEHAKICKVMLEKIDFTKKQKRFLEQTIRYFTELDDKTLFTVLFFAKNCKYIYLDRNIIRNSMRISKRFLGLLYWKLIQRKMFIKI